MLINCSCKLCKLNAAKLGHDADFGLFAEVSSGHVIDNIDDAMSRSKTTLVHGLVHAAHNPIHRAVARALPATPAFPDMAV